MKGKMHRRGRRAQTKHSSAFDGSETQLIESPFIGGNSEENDGGNTLPLESTLVIENTVPLENTLVLENTQMLENTVPLEDTVPLETQLLGEDKNKEEKGLLLEESDRDSDTEDTVDVANLEGYTEAKAQLLEDFQAENAIDSSRDKKDLDVVADSDDGGGGNTELLSEEEDASDGRSSPCRVDELKGNHFPVEALPSPNSLHGKETSQIHSSGVGKRALFNSNDSCCQHEQQTIVDSDASTEDESDVGEPQKSGDFNPDGRVHSIGDFQRSAQGVLPHRSRRPPSMTKLSQESSKVNKQLENIRILYQNPDPKRTKDGHQPKQDLNSDGLNSPKACQNVGIGQKMEMGVTPTGVTPTSITRASIGDSSDLFSTPTSGPRSIASVRVASLRASGLHASRMLSKTKEATSVKDAKSDAVRKHDSSSMPQSVLVARDKIGDLPGDKPSLKYKLQKATGPKEEDDHKDTANIYCEGQSDIVQSAQLRAENMTARKLLYTEAMEVDKLKPSDQLDDERRYRDSKEEGDEPRAIGRDEQDEQRAIGGNGRSEKLGAQVGDKEEAELSARVKNDKGGIPKEQDNSDIVNMKKVKSPGLYDLGFNKKSQNRPISSGLNYLDSQEPGEQSQADALNMVDKLVWLNTTGLSQEPEPEKLTEMTYSRPLSVRGTQNLAHLVECKSPKEKIGVFDWVDSQHDEGGCQFFRKNGSAVLSSRTGEDKVETESKQISQRSSKGKKGASVPNSKDIKIGKDKSTLLSQGLLKLFNSGGSDSNMTLAPNALHGRENKVGTKAQGAKATLSKGTSKSESAKFSRRSERLQLGEEQDLHKNQNIAEQNARGEKLSSNLGEVSEQMEKTPICRESLSSMSDVDNDTELAAEAMQSMPSEFPPNKATEENTYVVEQKGGTKSVESRKRKTRLSGAFKKGSLRNTDSENGETFAKQLKVSSSLDAQGKSRRVHWAEDEGQVQQKSKRKKQGIPRISKQDGKEKVESKVSEINEEKQDMIQTFTKVVRRKREGANVEVTSTPVGELQSARAGTEVRRFTRRMGNMNQGEMDGKKISSGSSEEKNDEEGDIHKGSVNAFKKKRRLETDLLPKPAREIQPAWAALEGMQSKAGTLARHSARQRNQKQMEMQKLEAQTDSKSPNTKQEAQDSLKSKDAEKSVGRKRKQADVEDISYKVGISRSTGQLSKSKVSREVDSTGADGEGICPKVGEAAIHSTRETKNLLDKQTAYRKPAIQDENTDTLWGVAKAVRSKRSQKNKDENYCKPSKPISAGEDLPAGVGEEVMHENVQEAAVRITRQSMRNLGTDVDSSICASTDIERDNSVLQHTVKESRSQRRKSGRIKTTSGTPNKEKLKDGASLIGPSKDDVQVNDTSADVVSPCTFQIPAHDIDDKSPASTGHGPETADSSKKGQQKKWTPRSNLKRELGRLDASETGQSSILKDSTRKKREPGNVHVLFSHGLDEDLVKQQRKILMRIGGQVTTSPADCTHFVTDKFVRTRNMLEAIAAGKPVVTHLWLENSGQASYFIDEKKYILEDAKKEKEIGFSMSSSLASAQQTPLLQGQRVFITPNTKPEKDAIISLVKAAKGQVLNSLKGSFSKKDENMENLIAISCEEDYEVCIPLLEKGVRVYSPEFLLNGIVVQSLDFSRDQLFTDHVKRMRLRQR